jgi:hypothetical protein
MLRSLQVGTPRGWNLCGSGIRRGFLGWWDPSCACLTPCFFPCGLQVPPFSPVRSHLGMVVGWVKHSSDILGLSYCD